MTTDQRSSKPSGGGVCTMNGSEAFVAIPIVKSSRLERRLAEIRKRLPYQIEYAKDTFSDELWQAMEHRELNQVEFAERANVSKQFLTKIFRGGNCTIETMVKLAFALDYAFNVHLTPNEVGCGWIHCVLDSSPRPPARFVDLWTESGYKPMKLLKAEVKRERVSSTS